MNFYFAYHHTINICTLYVYTEVRKILLIFFGGGWVSEGLREESAKNEVWIDTGNFLLLVHIVHKEYDSIYYLRWEIKKKCYMIGISMYYMYSHWSNILNSRETFTISCITCTWVNSSHFQFFISFLLLLNISTTCNFTLLSFPLKVWKRIQLRLMALKHARKPIKIWSI